MKPISLRFCCFGPYIKEQTIRFDELAEYGLFLICGETGSGKTTILDAMCCALYGSCSGEIRGELEAMRCKQAKPSDPTEVEFVFENEGKSYLFRRKLTPRKKRKADTEDSFNEDYSCSVRFDGKWIPLLDNCKKKSMNAKAAELLGLDLNQFRQVIILPQGKFETLLTSKSEEKESILSSLFHTERWKTAVERMTEELNARREAVLQDNQTIQDSLKRLEISSVAELPAAVEQAKKDEENAIHAEEEAKQKKMKAQELLNLSKEFQELDNRQENLNTAQKAAEEDSDLQERIDKAVKTEIARKPHDEWEQAKKSLVEEKKRLKGTEEKLASAETDLKQAAEEKERHAEHEPEQRQREQEYLRLNSLIGRYHEIENLQDSVNTARKVMDNANGELEKARKKAQGEKEKLQTLETAWNDAQDEYSSLTRDYQAATIGRLAAELKAGEACPVCGSLHHPSPAVLPKGSVTIKMIEDAEKRISDAREAFGNQRTVYEKAEEDRRETETAYLEARTEYDKALGALKTGLALRDPRFATLKELEQRCTELQNAINQYNEENNSIIEKCNQLNTDYKTLLALTEEIKNRKTDSEKELKDKEAAWESALAATGLGTEAQYIAMILPAEEQDLIRKTLSEHLAALTNARSAFNEQQRKLEGKDRPDSSAAETAFKEAEEHYGASISARTLAAERRNQLEKESERLIELDSRIAEKRKKYEEDSIFVRALRGSTGVSIQRYVLGVRLGQVIVEANRLLSGIYGGRYRLHRSDESYGSSHKSGLELEVYDNNSDQLRSVCTLSGGEKFLVALSLAIGLCTVVQNEQKGVSLEAMFIDEGFGSLDQNSLGDALDILQGVQRGRGMVGIISHIPLLEETIPTKIITKKTANGSDISRNLG